MSESHRIPDRLLERAHLGELPPEEMARLQERLAKDPDARARFAALANSDEEILAQYPATAMLPRIKDRARVEATREEMAKKPVRRAWLLAAPALAGAAVLALALVETRTDGDRSMVKVTTDSAPEVTREKGDAELVVQRHRGSEVLPLRRGEAFAHAGDILQLGYRAAGGAKYGAMISIDGRGTVTKHFPDGEAAGSLQDGGVVPLAQSYELDDAPRFEVFFLVTASEPFEVRLVTEAAAALSHSLATGSLAPERLELPKKLHQSSLVVLKTEQPR